MKILSIFGDRFCPKCGDRLRQDGAKLFCYHCGATFKCFN